eukprot:1140874-Pelagomonas_calceolata.AAC.2
MAISYTADNQLNAFMKENQRRQAEGMPVQLILDSGLWRYSRHPNYFGLAALIGRYSYVALSSLLLPVAAVAAVAAAAANLPASADAGTKAAAAVADVLWDREACVDSMPLL